MTEIEQQILAALDQPHGTDAALDAPLASIGIDSVGMAELTVKLEEEFDIRVDEYILDVETPRELAEYVVQQRKNKK
jgi:acyl carrier protein